jgi:hypothetical protein
VDRGSFGVEVILALLALKLLHPHTTFWLLSLFCAAWTTGDFVDRGSFSVEVILALLACNLHTTCLSPSRLSIALRYFRDASYCR